MSTTTTANPTVKNHNATAAMLEQFKAMGVEQSNRTIFGTPINSFLRIQQPVDARSAMQEKFAALDAVHDFASAGASSINELIAKRSQPNIWREAINELD